MTLLDGLLDDLAEESATLESVVTGLAPAQWRLPTPARGWTIRDQIAHLAWSDELAATAATDPEGFAAVLAEAADVDTAARTWGAGEVSALVDRWRAGRRRLAAALAAVTPGERVPWVGPAMSPASMATARLMETWAHGVDVRDALGLATPVTPRLRPVAHLGVATRDYAFQHRGETPPDRPFRVELDGPDGAWVWGPADAEARVSGPALDFCLRVTQRRDRAQLTLHAQGDQADRWLDIAQAFAG